MATFRKKSLIVLSVLLVVTVAFLVALFPGKKASASASPEFTLVQGASLRYPTEADAIVDGEEMRYKGLRFTTRVNDAWFTANGSEDCAFGTLVFPAKLGSVDMSKSVDWNENNLEAIEFKANLNYVKSNGYYTAAIVYDYKTVKELAISVGMVSESDPLIDDKIKTIMNKLYSMKLTAVSYVQMGDEVIYTDSYTTSMTQVAVKLIKDPEWTDKLSEYITVKAPVKNGYVTVSDGVVGNFDGTGAVEVFFNGASIDFTVNDGKIALSSSFTDGKLGTEEVITVLDENNNLTDVSVYYTDVAISTAEEFYAIFNSGDYNTSTVYPIKNDKLYVLMSDIDLSGYTFHNTANAGDIVLSGTLDGRGHTVSNATLDMTKASNKPTQGVFGQITGTVKNVAFVNLKGTANAGTDVGLTAPLSSYLSGSLENVFIDVSPANYNSRGPIATYAYTASMKNVVINFPQPDGFEFNDAKYEEVASSTGTYAYGYGALGYSISNLKKLENVYVISPMPVNYACGAGGSDKVDTSSLTSDYFTYGENETDVWYNFTYFADNGITEPTVENTKGNKGSSKTVVLSGLRRYANFTDMVSDSADKNVANIDALLSTGLWTLDNGNIKWHNYKVSVTVDSVVDYDADAGSLISTIFDSKDVVKVTVNGEELTESNGGLISGENGYVIRAKTSASDTVAGVPYMNNYITANRYFALTVYTSNGTYSFTNVRYNTMIINDAVELKTALDITYSGDTNNYGYFKLANDIDMKGVAFNYTGASTSLAHALKNGGFAGQFDGAGFAIKNVDSLGRFGLFGALNFGGGTAIVQDSVIVENLAIINFTSPSNATYGTPVLGQFSKTHNYGPSVIVRNVYLKYGAGAVANGLILEPGALVMENVLVDTTDTTQYGLAESSDGYFVEGDGVIDAWKTTSTTDGGSIFTRFRRTTSSLIPSLSNVISVGYTPLALQNWSGQSGWYSKLSTHTADGDGTYTHAVKNTGWGLTPITNEVYVGYAGNRKTGDVPIPKAFKTNFLTLVDKVAGSAAYAGYACLGCGETFQTSAGTCSCGTALTYYADLWSAPVSYVWEVPEIASYVNPTSSQYDGAFKFDGAYKYDTLTDMATAYGKDSTVYSSFLGETGNGLWGVNSKGELVWRNFVGTEVSIKVDGNAVSGKFNVEIGNETSIEVWNGTNQVQIKSLTTSSDVITVVGNAVVGQKKGSAIVTLVYVLDGVEFTKTLSVDVDHDYGELVVGVPSTCMENGTISHYKCSCCDKYFDAQFNEVADIVVIGSHAYGDWICAGDGTHYKVCVKDNTHVVRETCSGGEATCTSSAVCSTCNGTYGEPLGHGGGEATCDLGAICTRCGVEYTEKLGHTGGTATCESGPICTRCGNEYGEANGHTFTQKVPTEYYVKTPATCLKAGSYYYACTDCDAKSALYYTYGKALGHTGGTATCLNGPTCTRCGTEYGEAKGHTYTAKITTCAYLKTEANCVSPAVYYYACADCGEKSTKTYSYGDAIGHSGGTATCITRAKCSTCGTLYGDYAEHDYEYSYNDETHRLRCTICLDDKVVGEHDCSTTVVTKAPTCEEEGITSHVCECGYTVIEKTEKLDHKFGSFTSGTKATCTSAGVVGHYTCSTCGDYFDEYGVKLNGVIIPVTHNFTTYNQPIAPTCDQTGSKGFYHCEDCGKYFEFGGTEIAYSDISIPATGHNYNNPTGMCDCGLYLDVVGDVTIDPNNSYRATSKYFEFIYVGHIYPGQNTYKWGWTVNRFFGDLDGAPVHVKIPSQFYVPATDTYKTILSIGRFVFDTSGSHDEYYSINADNPYANTSPTNGNPENVAIQSVLISEGIEFIGNAAFSGTSIEELVIPNSVIGGYGTKVGTLATPTGASYNHLNYEWPLETICSGCTQLRRITIGSKVDVLGGYCFYGCSLLEKIDFVIERDASGNAIDGVEEIRQRAFGQNSGFAIDPTQPESKAGRIILPETLMSIPEGSIYSTAANQTVRLFKLFSPDPIYFLNITREELQARTIPAIMRDPEGNPVTDADGNVLFVDGTIKGDRKGYTDGWCGTATIYYKGEWYVDEDGYGRAYAEDAVSDIDYDFADSTFKMLNDGTLVGLTDYGKGLTEITVPSSVSGVSVVKIGSNAFKGANSLTSVILPSTVTEIADYGFADVNSLTNVTITSNVRKVGKDAFRKTLNVSSLTVKSQVANVNDVTISGTAEIGEICNSLGAFTMAISGKNYVLTTASEVYTLDQSGFVYTSRNVLVGYVGTATNITIYDNIVEIGARVFENSNVTNVVIPANVIKIGANAFNGSAITSITLPENLKEIGVGAFANTKITTIAIPSDVKVIPERAFQGCHYLSSVEWGGVTEIGYGAFIDCYSLKSIDLQDGIEIIGESAFINARGVRTITVPTSVIKIGAYAFTGLDSVYKLDYEGTKADWLNIDVHEFWNSGSPEFEIRCVDGIGGYLNVEEKVELVIGNTHQITYDIPLVLGGTLVWTSSDESVATVDNNGKITAVEEGVAEITVSNGKAVGICKVTVGYGAQLPNLVIENSVDEGSVFDVGAVYKLKPYITFNRLRFDDFAIVYESTDDSIATVQNGSIITKKTGVVQITAKATWRGFSYETWYGLEQTFEVRVVGSVEFKVNGGLPLAQSVYAPTAYTSDNVFNFVPTVVVDGSVYTPTVTINYLDGATTDDLVLDVNAGTITGYKLGRAEIILTYNAFGLKFRSKFLFEVLPNEVTLDEEVLFSAEDGYAFVKGDNGYVQTTMSDYLGGVVINSASSQGGDAFIDGDGALLGVSYSTLSLTSTTITVYTDTAKYIVPVTVAQKVIDTPEDFISALNLTSATKQGLTENTGYYLLGKNIDLSGYTLYNNTLTQGDARFSGTFDGQGFAVSNANIDMYRVSSSISQGIFGTIYSGAVVKNVAFINLKGTVSRTANDIGLQAPLAYSISGTLENVYVHVSPENFNNRGPIANYTSTAKLENYVIFYERADGYVFDEAEFETVVKGTTGKHAWGYGSMGSSLGFKDANVDNVYVISPTPLYLGTSGGGDSAFTTVTTTVSGSFAYGENETNVWYNFPYWSTLDTPITEPTVQNTVGIKTIVKANVRRYDSFSKMALDTSDRNVEKTKALLDTGLWIQNANGEIVWKSVQ